MSTRPMTPMLEQYLQTKEAYPDGLLFFRMGDFYELFFDDAEIAARELQITLTSRNPNQENKVPMCGVPHHALQEYTRQLLEKNYKIIICDQVEDPKQAKGLVKRAVTRVLSPGTVVEDANLQGQDSNYLCALSCDAGKGQAGVAWMDFSTGSWSGLVTGQEEEAWQWLAKLEPTEILCPKGQKVPGAFAELKPRITWLETNPAFDFKRSRDRLLSIQGVAGLEPLDLEDKPALVSCCGALLLYLQQTQKKDLDHLPPFQPLQLKKHLILDEVTERNLELFKRLDGGTGPGTLWQVLNQTRTPMGSRLLRFRLRHPFRDPGPIQAIQEMTGFFLERDALRRDIREILSAVYDLERLCTRIILDRGAPRDFISLRSSLARLPELQRRLEQGSEEQPPKLLAELLGAWDSVEDCRRLLDNSLRDNPPQLITEGGLFKPGYHQELDELLELSEHGEAKLKELLHKERERFDLPKLKLGFNRVFGYYFELSKAFQGEVPEHFHRRQTLANSERYLTEELKALEQKLFSAADKQKNLEYSLFQDLRSRVLDYTERIQAMAAGLARLDFWQSLAQTARDRDWCRPDLHSGQAISISQGRHPVVEAAQGGTDYIPNDLELGEQGRVLLITGPNMAGKSTVLRQAAIICILAQTGSYVPARACRLGLVDRIFTRVGASDNLAQGRSTFMVEMTEAARILRQAGKRSLVILDEIGRGTSTYDGLSLAWAMVENLARKKEQGVRTLFATHYHELTDLEGTIPGVKNFTIAVKEWRGEIVFLRKMVPGAADRSYGIEVAKLAGVPQAVVQRAKEILLDLESKSRNLKTRGRKESPQGPSLLPGLFKKHAAPAQNAPRQNRDHPVLQELAALDLNNMTPMQGLETLQKWKDLLEAEARTGSGS